MKFVLSLALSLFHISSHGAAQPFPTDSETNPSTYEQRPIEEIEVIGERNLISLQLEINAAEVQMFGLFNELNSTDQFDVNCRHVTPTYTRIRHWECESRFIREAFAQDAWEVLTMGAIPKTPEQIWWENRHKSQALNEEMLELAKENPELAEAMLDLNAKRERLEELQMRRREKTKGFFRGLFGKNDEQ